MLRPVRYVKTLLRSWLRPRKWNSIRREPTRLRPWLELLEDRLAPASGLSAGNQDLLQSYGQLPLSFEANQGQTDAQVDFLAPIRAWP